MADNKCYKDKIELFLLIEVLISWISEQPITQDLLLKGKLELHKVK